MKSHEHDKDGKYALSADEYYSLRQLFGAVSALELSMDILKERAQLIPGTWRDMRMISTVNDRILSNLMQTIPYKKLQQIRTELSHTVVKVSVVGGSGLPTPYGKERYCYTPERAMEKLIQNTLECQCFICGKAPKQAKKCPWRKVIEDVFPYDLPGDTDEYCKFSGYNLDTEYYPDTED